MNINLSHQEILTTLQGLESALHSCQTRQNASRLEELLHPAFQEFGRSGTAYNRAEIFALITAEANDYTIRAQNFQLQELSPAIYLLTYQSAHVAADGQLERHSNRSSIWQYTEAGWQMRFHHGSACPPYDML